MIECDGSDSETDLHVSEQLEDLHRPDNNVLDCLLTNATQRGCVNISRCLSLLLWLWRWRLSTKRWH